MHRYVMILLAFQVHSADIAAADIHTLESWRTPARFRIIDQVVATDIPAYTATVGIGPINSLLPFGGFEPMFYNTMEQVEEGGADSFSLPRMAIDDTRLSGYWDGAAVRIYRPSGGKLRLVRSDVIARHLLSGWLVGDYGSTRANQVTKPDASSIIGYRDGWNRRETDEWYSVVAIDTNGNESAHSNAVVFRMPADYKMAKGLPKPDVVNVSVPSSPSEREAPPAPTNFALRFDPATGALYFSWDPVTAEDLQGYRIDRSYIDPAAHEGFGFRLVGKAKGSEEHIRPGDFVFLSKSRTSFIPTEIIGNRILGTPEGRAPNGLFDNSDKASWRFVPHPQPVPAELAAEQGETCIEVTLAAGATEQFGHYNHSGTEQNYYQVLDPEATYAVEFWARQEGLAAPVEFRLQGPYQGSVQPLSFTVEPGGWKLYRQTFRVPHRLTKVHPIGMMSLNFTGPGKLWLDNYRIYDAALGYADWTRHMREELKASGISFLRIHSGIKTGLGYSMQSFTNARGGMGRYGTRSSAEVTLPQQLKEMRLGGTNPWLQVEICMNEDEWRGLVEYLCAPYDPAVDTPQKKPWAAKRHAQGQHRPWIDEFPRWLMEFGNETWNPMFRPFTFSWKKAVDEKTGAEVGGGQLYGMFQEHWIRTMKSSSYWTPEVERKFEFVVGGWARESHAEGYGQQAMRFTPSTRHMTVAAYNGGWDAGQSQAIYDVNGLQKVLAQPAWDAIPAANALERSRLQLAKTGVTYVNGVYEAGPGYSLPNTIKGDAVEQESRTMKSLAAGTATLDNFLYRSSLGWPLQNFFTLSTGRDFWTSHAEPRNGGQAYPSWAALSLFNRLGTGDFLLTQNLATPAYPWPMSADGAKTMDIGLVGCYATRQGDDAALFLLSRKMDGFIAPDDDGFTPVTVELPFASVKAIELHRMTGDPRRHNLDGPAVKPERIDIDAGLFKPAFALNTAVGADDRGLPPGSVFVYVFRKVAATRPPADPVVVAPSPGQQPLTLTLPYKLTVHSDRPIAEPSVEAFSFVGGAKPASLRIEPVFGSGGASWNLIIDRFHTVGTVDVKVAAGALRALDGTALPAGGMSGVLRYDLPDAGGTVINPVMDDAQVANRGSTADGLRGGMNTNGLPASGSSTNIYLKFPAIAVPGREILSATLTIHCRGTRKESEIVAFGIEDDAWSETTITGDNAPERRVANVIGATKANLPEGGVVSIDITGFARGQITKDSVVSVVLGAKDSGNIGFVSKEWGQGLSEPRLVISYGPKR